MNLPTVLLVEDDPNDIRLTQRAFRMAGLNVSLQIVQDGDSAVSYLNGEAEYQNRDRYPFPILALLDLKLPRRSGHEVLSWVRQQPQIKRLPIVVLTSSKELVDINQAYDLGANAYLTKPIGFAALLELIRTLNLFWLLLNEYPEIQPEA